MPQHPTNLDLPQDEFGYIILGNGEYIAPSDFVSRFGDVLDYEILINSDNITPRWIEIFERWKSEGVII